VPVIKIPPCIEPAYDHRLKRSDYNLPDDCFLFLCAYDVLSVQERKNPLGAIEAFKRAFSRNDSAVGLVIKVNNARQDPVEIKHLRSKLQGYSNCFMVEEMFDRSRMNSLLHLIDVYISLHRSEGFGLIPAEAMSFGKPVVMTKWSGNVDFMTDDNSCGIDYKLIPVGKTFGPYTTGQFWADPDIDQAAYYMQKLYTDKEYYSLISARAEKTIHDSFSPSNIGKLIKDRMEQIGLIS
jgi:glycosyltransferase involved in cell wall biosynthesis